VSEHYVAFNQEM